MNMKIFKVFLTLCLFTQVFGHLETYRGAVVEYHPTFLSSEKETVEANVERFANLMKAATSKGAEIIVFPEHGLHARTYYTPIPDPVEMIIPCVNTTFNTTLALRNLSCASRDNKIYSVINLLEKRECVEGDDCPPRGFFIYNTNVVFDRLGTVIARYPKFNLFDEKLTDHTKNPVLGFFDTDFGVRFGTFICFDILFGTPTLKLIEQYQITNFVFSTFWFSELPFFTATQIQKGWAETNNVNLLASGVNLPKVGSTGSGIFNGKFGALLEVFPETNTTKLLVARIPKERVTNEKLAQCERRSRSVSPDSITQVQVETGSKSELFLLRDQIYRFNSKVIEVGKRFEGRVCSANGFCCEFRVRVDRLVKESRGYNFRAVAFDGVRKFGETATGGVQTCGVILCHGPSLLNCTDRAKDVPGLFKFTEIGISGRFLLRNSLQLPSTLTDGEDLLPLPVHKYEFKKKEVDGQMHISLDLIWPDTNLRTFAILGRDFTRDGQPPTLSPNSSPCTEVSLSFLLFAFIVSIVFRN